MSHLPSKSSHRPRAVSRIARQDDSRLGGLLRQAQEFQQLDRLFAGMLGPGAAVNCRVACLRDSALVLLASTPVWASRLKLQSAELLEKFHRAGHSEIKTILVKVSPPAVTGSPAARPKRLSKAARMALQRLAENSDDQDIQLIAQRLSARTND